MVTISAKKGLMCELMKTLQGTVKNRYQDIEIRRIAREEFLKAIQFLLRSSTSKENLRQLLK
jgi:hypothetical protein